MAGRRSSRWRGIAMAALLVGLAASLLVIGLPTAVNVVTLVSAVLTVPPLAVAWLRWQRSAEVVPALTGADVAAAKEALAGSVLEQWRTEAALRALGNPDPIPVQWRLTVRAEMMDHPRNVGIGIPPVIGTSDQIAALASRFRALRRRRLVILGRPGTGKTTLAVQLVLELLASRRDEEPVPVLFSVADWDTQMYPRLHDWLGKRLEQDYPALRAAQSGAEVPRSLAARGEIVPVLDGLDELPEAARAGVIAALKRSLGDDDQLILTSRTGEFIGAVREARAVITSAIVIESQPLSPTAAADYLHGCLPPVPGPVWERILIDLRTETQPARPATPLAEIASTALGLWLLRTVYLAPSANPAPLLDRRRFPTTAELRAHLFDQLVIALINARPPGSNPSDPFRPRHHWDPEQVRDWLSYLARYLKQMPAADGRRGTRDFAWWQLADNTLHRRALPLVVGTVGGFATAVGSWLVAAVADRLTPELPPDKMPGIRGPSRAEFPSEGMIGAITRSLWEVTFGPQVWVAVALVLGLLVGVIGGLAARAWSKQAPGFATFHVSGRPSLPIRITLFALALTLWAWLLVFMSQLLLGFGVGIVAALALLLRGSRTVRPLEEIIPWFETPSPEDRASTPRSNWQADRTLNLVRSIVVGLLAGTALGVGGGLTMTHWTTAWSGTWFLFLLVIGLVFGLVAGLAGGKHHAWVAYIAVTHHLALSRRLPRSLMLFLDDAHRLGLLRAVGPLYQFRHAEFQDHLTEKGN